LFTGADMKLIVLNLPRDYSEDELAKLFKIQGNIKSCDLVMDEKSGKSKGFGFVEMALDHEAINAIKELHNTRIGRNKIRVGMAD
jgi:RNA recognition motif-containing protein